MNLYVFTSLPFHGYYISSIDPDITEDWEAIASNAIAVAVNKKQVPEIEMGIARNVLSNGGAKVVMR